MTDRPDPLLQHPGDHDDDTRTMTRGARGYRRGPAGGAADTCGGEGCTSVTASALLYT